jgi:DNA invertase Pin-like site-specific DNA recombinase
MLWLFMRRAIAILRVSTDAQDTDRQKTDIERVERAHSLTIERVVELDGVSGRKVRENDHMKRVLADLNRPDIAGVVVSALDRLFRLDKFADFGILDNFKDTGKMIYSAKEGALDLRTDAGLILSLMSGAQSGLEWRELRRRTTQGKEVLRTRGGNPNGRLVLPRGVGYEPVKSANGRTIGGKWFYTEPDATRIRRAYDLLFERRSYRDIVARIGGGFTNVGIRGSLANPIWMGIRKYAENREEPLELRVIDPPLISPERWEAAQAIILEKRTRWAKTKHLQPRCLLTGLLRCACGRAAYLRRCHRKYSYYDCSSKVHGSSCGARGVQQPAADRTFEHFLSHEFLDAAFLRSILARFEAAAPARDDNRDQLARQRQMLEAERQRLLRMTLRGDCSEDDFARESKRIETEMRDLDRLAPAPVPAAIDPAELVMRIHRIFGTLRRRPLEEKRDLLRTVLKEIILKNGAVTAITINGGFLDSANSQARS